MNYPMTDNEQIEMIRKWWNSYGKVIAIAVMIGLVVAFGWRYWNHHQQDVAQKASGLYGQFTVSNSQGQIQIAQKIASDLMQNYSRTPYATLAALWFAQSLVKNKNYEAALQKLNWVTDHSRDNSFKQVARLRSARILLAQKNSAAALDILNKVDDKTYQPFIDETRGDIFTAMNQLNDAKKAYQSAKTGFSTLGIQSPLLELKLANS